MVLIKDLRKKKVATITKGKSVVEAAKKMAKLKISCLVVVYGGKVEGIITTRDIIDKVVAVDKNTNKIKVGDAMTSPVKTISSDKNLLFASAIMNGMSIKQLPVLEKNKLIGIVTQTDIVRNLNRLSSFEIKGFDPKL